MCMHRVRKKVMSQKIRAGVFKLRTNFVFICFAFRVIVECHTLYTDAPLLSVTCKVMSPCSRTFHSVPSEDAVKQRASLFIQFSSTLACMSCGCVAHPSTKPLGQIYNSSTANIRVYSVFRYYSEAAVARLHRTTANRH